MAAIAATTRRIRVGSAGVMLPHYSALKVAEQFRVLEAHRARADRPGRGPRARLGPADRLCAESARQRGRRVPAAGARARSAGSRASRCRDDHPVSPASRRTRRGPTSPEIWILGSSDYGARLAAHFGLPYAFAYFFSDGRGVDEALALYRRNYRPERALSASRIATICVWALAADTEAEARRLLTTREFWRVGFEQGLRNPLVSPEQAVAHPYTAPERARDRRRCAGRPSSATREEVAAQAARRWRSASNCRSSSSTPGPTTRPRGAAPTSCWPPSSGLRAPSIDEVGLPSADYGARASSIALRITGSNAGGGEISVSAASRPPADIFRAVFSRMSMNFASS